MLVAALIPAVIVRATVSLWLVCQQQPVILAAQVTTPGLPSLPDRDTGNGERGKRVGPSPAEEGVGARADQEGHGALRAPA